jgi:hypothetical protein
VAIKFLNIALIPRSSIDRALLSPAWKSNAAFERAGALMVTSDMTRPRER